MCGEAKAFERAGVDLVVVGNGTVEHAKWFKSTHAIEAAVLTDPQLCAYRAVGAKSGWSTVLRLGVFRAAWRAFRGGFRQTGTKGEALQQGGVFLIRPDGSAPFAYRSEFAGDHPETGAVLAALSTAGL